MLVKSLVILLAAIAGSVVHAADCPNSELSKLATLAVNSNVGPCSVDSGFSLFPPSGKPNDAQLIKMCKSSACRNMIEAMRGLNLANCDLKVGGTSTNMGQIVSSFDGNCARLVPRTRKQFPPC